MALFSRRPKPDKVYGTGLWRQHRDRFNRAVDRFYRSAAAVHKEANPDDPAQAEAAEALAALTLDLNSLGERVDAAARQAHEAFPVRDLVVPAQVRAVVGEFPEDLSKAGHMVAQSAQAAAMTHAAIRMGTDPLPSAHAAQGYARDAAELVDRCAAALQPNSSRQSSPSTDPSHRAAR